MSSGLTPITYQANDVKRADGCIAGAEGPSEEHLVTYLCQAIAADLISVAGHSLCLHQTPIEGQCSRPLSVRRTGVPVGTTPEKLSTLIPVFSIPRVVSEDTPS